jgi:hypothetical protein
MPLLSLPRTRAVAGRPNVAPLVSNRSLTIGRSTRSGVKVALLAPDNLAPPVNWQIISGDTSGHFAIDTAGRLTVTSTGQNNLLSSYTLAIRAIGFAGNGDATLTITTTLHGYNFTTATEATAAQTHANANLTSADVRTYYLTEGIVCADNVTFTHTTLTGTIVDPSDGLSVDSDIVAIYNAIEPDLTNIAGEPRASIPSGGYIVVTCATQGGAVMSGRLLVNGGVGIIENIIFTHTPTIESYDARFDYSVTQELLWTPAVTSGAITGLGAVTQVGQGYLPGVKHYVSTKKSGAGSGFQGYFVAKADGTIDATCPLTVTAAGSSYTITTVLGNPAAGYGAGLQSTDTTGTSASESQIQFNSSDTTVNGVGGYWIVRRTLQGSFRGGNDKQTGISTYVVRARTIVMEDNVIDGYYGAIEVRAASRFVARFNWLSHPINDSMKIYPSGTGVPLTGQTELVMIIVGNYYDKVNQSRWWTNSHGDRKQTLAAGDTLHNNCIDICNYWNQHANVLLFATQGNLDSVTSNLYQKLLLRHNFGVNSTVNFQQVANAHSSALYEIAYNTGVRSNYLNAASYGNFTSAGVRSNISLFNTYLNNGGANIHHNIIGNIGGFAADASRAVVGGGPNIVPHDNFYTDVLATDFKDYFAGGSSFFGSHLGTNIGFGGEPGWYHSIDSYGSTIQDKISYINGMFAPVGAAQDYGHLALVTLRDPAITGTAYIGGTLTVTPGKWSCHPTLTYQWKADGVTIAGATNNTFSPTISELGKVITVVETASKTYGINTVTPLTTLTKTKTSAATSAVIGQTISLSGTFTEANDTESSTTSTITATLSATITEASDTISSTVAPVTSADLTITEVSDTLSATEIAVTPVTFDGTDYLRKATGGLNASPASATLTRTSNTITGVTATTDGAGYEPNKWQIITASTGGGTGFRGEVQARSDGTLDWTTFRDVGTANADGSTLSTGSSYTSNPPAVITRLTQHMVGAIRMKLNPSFTAGDVVIGQGNSRILWRIVNSGSPATARHELQLGTATQCRVIGTNTVSTSTYQTFMFALDFSQPYATGGFQSYLDGTNDAPVSPTAFVQNYNGMDMSNTNAVIWSIMSNSAGGTNVLEADVEFVYLAYGKAALDSVTGEVPDLSSSTVRDRFLPTNIGSTGAGVTGSQPQIFFGAVSDTASTWNAGTNHGTGGTFTMTGAVT